ncbi:hypothetical protein BFL36_11650 [Clavibacter michiganensis]|uniref:Uncharacterized protein n=1 Tax=Clavibacter michiganensis TaxID=28447 RepID=A0A251Y7R3_9MICO|nr:hypothetical protein BFL36_11650 [Clavibacter michiganensis]
MVSLPAVWSGPVRVPCLPASGPRTGSPAGSPAGRPAGRVARRPASPAERARRRGMR